jgi:hypothetical protein
MIGTGFLAVGLCQALAVATLAQMAQNRAAVWVAFWAAFSAGFLAVFWVGFSRIISPSFCRV